MNMGLRWLAVSALAALGLVSLVRADVRIVSNLPGAYVDITDVGTRLVLADDGSQTLLTSIGNSLLPPGAIRISNNGVVAWGSINIPAVTNTAIPDVSLCNGTQTLAVYWDD